MVDFILYPTTIYKETLWGFGKWGKMFSYEKWNKKLEKETEFTKKTSFIYFTSLHKANPGHGWK